MEMWKGFVWLLDWIGRIQILVKVVAFMELGTFAFGMIHLLHPVNGWFLASMICGGFVLLFGLPNLAVEKGWIKKYRNKVALSIRLGGFIPFPGFTSSSLAVSNDEYKRDTTAHAITASMEWMHVDGERHTSVGVWFIEGLEGGAGPWRDRVSIRSGFGSVHLPLVYWDAATLTHIYFLVDRNTLNINEYGILLNVKNPVALGYGEWKVLLELSGDNAKEKWGMTATLGPQTASYSPPKRTK